MFLFSLAAAAYLAWIVFGGRSAADQLSPAPLARALIGKTIGDNVEVSTPRGARSYEIAKVQFK